MAQIKKQIEARQDWTVKENRESNWLEASFYNFRLAFQLEVICKADDAPGIFGDISGKIAVYQMVCGDPTLWNDSKPQKNPLSTWEFPKDNSFAYPGNASIFAGEVLRQVFLELNKLEITLHFSGIEPKPAPPV